MGGVWFQWAEFMKIADLASKPMFLKLFLLVKSINCIDQASQHWFNLPVFRIPVTSPVPFHTGKAYFLFTGSSPSFIGCSWQTETEQTQLMMFSPLVA